MRSIFKYGDHIILGISMMYIKPAQTYTLMFTFFFIHLTIDFMNYGTRMGIGIGIKRMLFKIHAGIKI